jgi:hypothetical protein
MNENIIISPNVWTLIPINNHNRMFISCVSNSLRYSFTNNSEGIPIGNSLKTDRDIYIKVIDSKDVTIIVERI